MEGFCLKCGRACGVQLIRFVPRRRPAGAGSGFPPPASFLVLYLPNRNLKSSRRKSVRYWDCFVRFRTSGMCFQQLGGFVFQKNGSLQANSTALEMISGHGSQGTMALGALSPNRNLKSQSTIGNHARLGFSSSRRWPRVARRGVARLRRCLLQVGPKPAKSRRSQPRYGLQGCSITLGTGCCQ